MAEQDLLLWSNIVALETEWLTPPQNPLEDKTGWFTHCTVRKKAFTCGILYEGLCYSNLHHPRNEIWIHKYKYTLMNMQQYLQFSPSFNQSKSVNLHQQIQLKISIQKYSNRHKYVNASVFLYGWRLHSLHVSVCVCVHAICYDYDLQPPSKAGWASLESMKLHIFYILKIPQRHLKDFQTFCSKLQNEPYPLTGVSQPVLSTPWATASSRL